MIWQEFVSALDVVRSEIRSERDLKAKCPGEDIIYKRLQLLLEAVDDWDDKVLEHVIEPVQPVIDVPADLAACVPDEEPQDIVVPRGDGEGRMVIERRKTPLIVREPNVVEVTEKELAK